MEHPLIIVNKKQENKDNEKLKSIVGTDELELIRKRFRNAYRRSKPNILSGLSMKKKINNDYYWLYIEQLKTEKDKIPLSNKIEEPIKTYTLDDFAVPNVSFIFPYYLKYIRCFYPQNC